MKYQAKQLHDLLEASRNFLENPESEKDWLAFQQTLEAVENAERAEKAQGLAAQPEMLKNATPETRQMLRRYYEEELRPRNRVLLWSSVLIALIIGGYVLSIMSGGITPASFPAAGNSPTASPSLTSSPTTSATSTATASPSVTASYTSTLTPSPTATHTPLPSRTATHTPRPTHTQTPEATTIPLLTSGQMAGSLTTDRLARRYEFRVQAGDIVIVRLNSDEFDPYLAIQDEDGNEIASNDDCGSLRRSCVGPIQVSSDGLFVIMVDSYSRHETGSYVLEVAVTKSPQADESQTPTPGCDLQPPRAVVSTPENSINLRSGPGRTFSIIGLAYPGECFAVVMQSRDNLWLKIQAASGRTGWILARLTQVDGDLEAVPVSGE